MCPPRLGQIPGRAQRRPRGRPVEHRDDLHGVPPPPGWSGSPSRPPRRSVAAVTEIEPEMKVPAQGVGHRTPRELRGQNGAATRQLRDTLRDTRRSLKSAPNRPPAGRETALQRGPAPPDGLTGNVEGLVRLGRLPRPG